MGLFKKRADPAEMEAIKADIAAMAARLDQADADKAELGTRVQRLTSRSRNPDLDAALRTAAIAPVTRRAEAADHRRRPRHPAGPRATSRRSARPGRRPHHVDLDRARQPDHRTVGRRRVDRRCNQPARTRSSAEIRDAQVELANEQARYQIAFREDLAALAERLRRP